jgi:uridine kinase
VLVGLSGGSCSGKTTLAKALLELSGSATFLAFDDYYRDLSHMTLLERAAVNYDHPDALDVELFVSHMDDLAEGKSVKVPEYDMSTHTRPGGSYHLEPAPLVIVDGILLMAVKQCRERLDLKIFVDAPREVRLARRLVRDTEERGRDPQSVEEQFVASVEPMHQSLVLPSSQYADLRFDHPFDPRAAAQAVWAQIGKA